MSRIAPSFSPAYVDLILEGARASERDSTRLRNLRAKVENVLRNFHRNAVYPESDSVETQLAVDAILRAVKETAAESDPDPASATALCLGG